MKILAKYHSDSDGAGERVTIIDIVNGGDTSYPRAVFIDSKGILKSCSIAPILYKKSKFKEDIEVWPFDDCLSY